MIIKMIDRKLPLAKELQTKTKLEHILFCLVSSGIWSAMIAWVLASWL